MFSVHHFLHIFIITVGATLNIAAIAVILMKRSKAFKEFSLLLLNMSIVELSSIIAHFLVDARLFIDGTTTIVVSSGPCQAVSENFCTVITAFMHINMMHSVTVLGLSFWYRLRALSAKEAFGRLRLQTIIIVLFVPHLFHIAVVRAVIAPRHLLEPVFDRFYGTGSSRSFGLIGLIDITDYAAAITSSYLAIFPSFFTNYIICARKKIIEILKAKAHHMSVKTLQMHQSFTKMLTIHTVISSVLVIIVMILLADVQIFFHFHSVDLEGLIYDTAVTAAVLNPALTLYFVTDYRKYVLSFFSRAARKVSSTSSQSIQFTVIRHSSVTR